jgi:cysteine desulfurase
MTIYFNANGTTCPNNDAITETVKWMHKFDTNSKENKELIFKATKYISKLCNINDNDYCVIFTSGASESNSTIIRSIVNAYFDKHNQIPHVITSSIEHKSVLNCCETLCMSNLITYTKIEPNIDGRINPSDIEYAIRKNTCLITIMYSNNEIGSINDVLSINYIANKYNIPFHSDCVQMFGKTKIDVNNFTSIAMSFHKLYYLKGIGLLILNKKFMNDNKLKCIIAGTQQYGYRGGTLPNYLIAGSLVALQENFYKRNDKNKHLLSLKNYFLTKLNKLIPIEYYVNNNFKSNKLCIILFGSTNLKHVMVNTCLISVYSPIEKFCNMKIKSKFEEKDIIISIGSNCNADNAEASHVINALKVDATIRRGTLRISFGDNNTTKEIDKFIDIFLQCINDQIDVNNLLEKKIPKLVKKIRFKTNMVDIMSGKPPPVKPYY